MDIMPANFAPLSEDLLGPPLQPQVFRLSQSEGPVKQFTLWGEAHEAPLTLGNCHKAIERALAGEQENDLSWWGAMLERHLDQVVSSYMAGCRRAQRWNFVEIALVHWYAFALKVRLRTAHHFPTVWNGASKTFNALQAIQSA